MEEEVENLISENTNKLEIERVNDSFKVSLLTNKNRQELNLNNSREFYRVTSAVEQRLDEGNLEAAKNYVEYASSKTDNTTVKKYAKIIEKVSDDNGENLSNIKKSVKNITNTARKNMELYETEISAEVITRNILIVLINIALISIFAFVWFGEIENNQILKEKLAAKKAAKKAEKKTTAKKVTKK